MHESSDGFFFYQISRWFIPSGLELFPEFASRFLKSGIQLSLSEDVPLRGTNLLNEEIIHVSP
ncbi:MAG: hypothetical protein CL914_04980 [Deltaproteobacteria bacterium]|nr:hypothetical protein [Deltaproteobacteria bacterium]